MSVNLSEQQQLALFDLLSEAKNAIQAAKDKLVTQPNEAEAEEEIFLLRKIANLEHAENILRPLTKKISG